MTISRSVRFRWKIPWNLVRILPADPAPPMPENSTNEEIERLRRRREELKEKSEQIEKRLERLQTELKKVTGRIILPEQPKKE
jgi:DNA repair exonuclease SbcCD ATPase subunit